MALLRILHLLLLSILASMVFHPAWSMDGDAELLPEDQAFAFSAELMPDGSIAVRWDIAEGYYMYRDKMGFEVVPASAASTLPALPPGKRKHDELFGEVDVYTDAFELVLPLASADSPVTLVAKGQGCNEPVGVCYPPMQHEIAFQPGISAVNTTTSGITDIGALNQSLGTALDQGSGLDGTDAEVFTGQSATGGSLEAEPDPVAELQSLLQPRGQTLSSQEADTDTSTDSGNADDSVAALRQLLDGGFEQPEFLPPEEAFPITVSVVNGNTLEARYDVVDGYYLYRDKITFSASGDARIGGFDLPAGEEKNDEFFGLSEVYKHSFSVPITLQRTDPAAGSIIIEAGYQGCADQGICYPPSVHEITLPLPAVMGDAVASDRIDAGNDGEGAVEGIRLPGSDADIGSGSLFSILLGALFAGLLLTFTPCVLPMIPILSSVIAGQGENLTRMRGGGLAIVYVLGTMVTYAAMGWIAGATGEQLQAYFQNAWAIGILSAVFVLMALSMFGLYEIQMPAAIQTRLQSSTSSMGGSVPLVFVLGLASALIVGACVSPILISFLGIAVTRADPVLGAQMMFVMAIGMGIPLVILGFGAGYLLPRAGAWMDLVKHFFGVLLIGVSIYLLGVLPAVPVLLLWGVFFIVLSTYLGATQSLPEGISGWRRLAKGIGTVLLVWGIAALIGGFYGQRDLLQPLPEQLFAGGVGEEAGVVESNHLFKRINNTEELDREFDQARNAGRRSVLDY